MFLSTNDNSMKKQSHISIKKILRGVMLKIPAKFITAQTSAISMSNFKKREELIFT